MAKSKSKVIPATAIDVGSGRIKIAHDLQNYRIIPSFLCLPSVPYTQGNYFEDKIENEMWQLSDKSFIVEYISGSNEDLIGRTWLVGESAKYFEDEDAFPLFTREKTDFAAHATLGCLVRPDEEETDITINDLIYSLPYLNDKNKITESLRGTHQLRLIYPRLNEKGVGMGHYSKEVTLTINNIHTIGEGVLPHKWIEHKQSTHNPLLHTQNKGFGIIDIGTKTAILNLISYDPLQGYVPKPGAWKVIPEGGMHSLAKRIQKRLASKGTYIDRLDLILQGIEDKTFQYGQNDSITFKEEYTQEHARWFNDLKNEIKNTWSKSFSHEIGEVLIIGGGANAAKSLERWEVSQEYAKCPVDDIPNANKRFHRCPIQQEGNVIQVLAMYYYLYFEKLNAKEVIMER